MRHRTIAVLSLALVLAALLGAGSLVRAQHGPDPAMPPGRVGTSVQPLGGGLPSAAPGYALTVSRLTYAPGGTLNTHTHPGASILHVESGALTYTLIEGTAHVTRATTGPATPGAASVVEPLGPGEIVLNVGDSLFEDADVVHTARNAGDVPAVILIAALLKAAEPVTTFLEATPEP